MDSTNDLRLPKWFEMNFPKLDNSVLVTDVGDDYCWWQVEMLMTDFYESVRNIQKFSPLESHQFLKVKLNIRLRQVFKLMFARYRYQPITSRLTRYWPISNRAQQFKIDDQKWAVWTVWTLTITKPSLFIIKMLYQNFCLQNDVVNIVNKNGTTTDLRK